MRDGRRKRLGLAEGTEGTVQDAYLDRILSNEDVAGETNILNIDPDANVRTTDNRYIQDAYNYFLGGGTGNFADEVAIAPDFTGGELINTGDGDGGQATSGVDLSGNTDFEQSLLDQPMIGGITGDPIEVEDLSLDKSGSGMSGTIGGAPDVFDINEVGDPSQNPGSINVGDQPMAPGPFDYLQEQTPLSQVQVPGLDYSQAAIDAERLAGYTPSFGSVNEVTEDPTMQETISNAFTSARQGIGDLAEASVDKIQEVGQSIANTIGGVYNGVDQTVSVFGREINVPGTLAGIALGQAINFPVTLAFGVAKAIGGALPEGGRGDVSNALGGKYGMDDIGRLTGGPMAGYSVGPNHAQTVQNRIDSIKNRNLPQTDASRQKISELEAYKDEVIATGASGVITEQKDSSGNVIDTTVVGPGEMPVTQDEIDAFNEPTQEEKDAATAASNAASVDLGAARYGDGGPGYEGPTGGFGGYEQGAFADDATGSDTSPGATGGEGGFDDDSFSDANTGFDTSPGATGGEGGSGNSGGGKIVCTMMNNSYGFGSFRNKIWLKHSRDMAPEYQIGYHKIFLPLIKIAKTNKVLKKILEHIAIHRTIDIRQESRGKTHLLGRVYRKILEPICYIVGKYAK